MLQQYFNNRLWYDGRIDPADFDEGVLNACEKANIQTIQNRQMQIE